MSRIPTDDLAPETDNSEQSDDGQAQDVADDALGLSSDLSEDSEHGGRANPAAITPDDVPDLVDTMNQMVTSGRIDNGAFRGEPMHDDEEDGLGQTDSDDDNE
ncbi:hypothetical protein PQ455_13650 [Sphingomonas naphthae]|uniref:Uncharacterized protein n=1 Tax=Sphingomonas naphthae TaxID=1813468 RepID=A0ABY7TIW8_9SPHN|nr:hypothetical protein [Sphingomonas naphthae]WCT72672.1 hypothetical protein PQ455_13650 [Sphingomonas naphthae]